MSTAVKKKSLAKRIKDRVRPRWVKVGRKLVSSRLKLEWLTRRFKLRPINCNPLARLKTSDTLYILGSGESVNRLGPQDWQRIGEADSVGFNFWLVHDFVPSLYVFEPMDEGTPPYECLFADFQARSADYRHVPLLLKDGERHHLPFLERFLARLPESLRRNLSLSWDWEIPGEDTEAFARSLRSLHRRGVLTGSLYPAIRKRASVFYLILLGLRAGYRRIVLCGIDLNNTRYFYEAHREDYAAQGRTAPPSPPPAPVHLTDDPRHGELTITRAIEILQREVLQPAGIELFVAFKSSRLFPVLPSFFEPPQ